MGKTGDIIYIKVGKNVVCHKQTVTIGDVFKLEITNLPMARQVKQITLYRFPAGTHYVVFSILKVIELIHERYPAAEIVNLGEADFVLEYVNQPERTVTDRLRVGLLAVLVFFGAAFTIMAFHNDISIVDLFDKIYVQVVGGSKPAVTELEISYCIGIVVGILVFFNHVGKKKITSDATPLQVEMRKYENDMDTTLIENASRKGHNQDVE